MAIAKRWPYEGQEQAVDSTGTLLVDYRGEARATAIMNEGEMQKILPAWFSVHTSEREI